MMKKEFDRIFFYAQINSLRGAKLHRVLFVFVFILLCLLNFSVNAQLKRVPLQVKSKSKAATASKLINARTEDDSPLSLPFFDDFSRLPSDGNGIPFPNADASLWVNSNSVWINNGMAINPPSVNVATFDGLDSVYLPYEESQVLLNGITDKLVSKPIDLSVLTPDKRNTVYLSFFYQWAGNGEPPDPTDYLQLEFLNKDTVWEVIERIQPEGTFKIDTFYYINEKVDTLEQRFFHDHFQFKISRYGRESGPFDTWNVDYIYLNSDRSADDKYFPDIAISTPATALFKPYQAVPVKHFFYDKHLDNVWFVGTNLKSGLVSVTYKAKETISDYYKNKPSKVYSDTLISNPDGKVGSAALFADERGTAILTNLPDVQNTSYFDSTASEIDIKLTFKVKGGTEEDAGGFISNDTLSTVYKMKDYYAYDDGIAEYSVVLTQPGNAAAVEFDMITPKPDTLIGFYIYFPAYGISANQTVNLAVYSDDNGQPGTAIRTSNSYLVQRKEVNEFSRIVISPVVVQGKFYVGWTEPGSELIKVGLDFSNDAGDKIFVKVGSTWSQNNDVQGAVMIRPIFGGGDIVAGLPEEHNIITCYPNPNNGTFFIRGKYDHLDIVSSTGQSVNWQSEDVGDDKKITMQSAPGFYLVRIQKGNAIKTGKLIIK